MKRSIVDKYDKALAVNIFLLKKSRTVFWNGYEQSDVGRNKKSLSSGGAHKSGMKS